jgi:hypothetical protein
LSLLLIGYAALLGFHFSPAISDTDANGYWTQGTLITQTGGSTFALASDAQYLGLHWLLTDRGEFISRYPPGLSLLIGLVFELFGWAATLLINPVLAGLTLAGAFLLASRWTSPAWGLLAASLIAINPAFTEHALTDTAHMLVACLLVWGVLMLVRWSSHQRLVDIALAGLLLGCIPTVRYPDAIIALGVGAFMLLQAARMPRFGVHLLVGLGAALLPIIPLLVRNHVLLGGFWRTGYSLTAEQSGFSLQYFSLHAGSYMQMLQVAMGALFALGLVGMIAMLASRRMRAPGTLLTLIAVPLVCLYSAYYWSGNAPYGGAAPTRFIVPLIALFSVSAVWMLRAMLHRTPAVVQVAAPTLLLVLQLVIHGDELPSTLQRVQQQKTPLALLTDALLKSTSAGDVVISAHPLHQHLEFLQRWKLADASLPSGRPTGDLLETLAPGQPFPQQPARAEFRRGLYADQAQSGSKFRADVIRWAAGQDIYFVGHPADMPGIPGFDADEWSIVATVTPPGARPYSPPATPPTAHQNPPQAAPGAPKGVSRSAYGGMPARPGETNVIARFVPGRSAANSTTSGRSL